MEPRRTIRIGSGADFADDRIEPAVELAERGELDYLVFECLAERTIALAQLDRLRGPLAGYNEWLPDRMRATLATCVANGALAHGADVVLTGRTADPSLHLAPLVHKFGWALDDWARIGRGICPGLLLECAAQVTGGYFADPRRKDVPDLARLGFPIAEADADSTFVVTKVAGTSGRVDRRTCTEQLLYEVHDPAAYVSADAVADFSSVHFRELGADRVEVTGATGRARPDQLKVSVGYLDGFLGEGQISCAGTNAVARGRLALDIVRERLAITDVSAMDMRYELIGVDAVRRGRRADVVEPPDVRVRVAGRTGSLDAAERIGREVSALWLNGPAGSGGATRRVEQVVAIESVLVPRHAVCPEMSIVEA